MPETQVSRLNTPKLMWVSTLMIPSTMETLLKSLNIDVDEMSLYYCQHGKNWKFRQATYQCLSCKKGNVAEIHLTSLLKICINEGFML